MNPSQDTANSQSASNTIPSSPKQRSKKPLLIILLVILGAGLAAGGYWYGNNQNKAVTPAASTSTSSSTASQQSSSATHFVTSLGYPFDLKTTKITTQLGFPSFLQAVRDSSDNNNHGPEQYLTDKYNDEMARFAIGNPTNPIEDSNGISILAIGKSWLASTSTDDASFYYNFGSNSLQTPAQKQQYVSMVKSDTDACYKDPAKGFTTADGFFKICYSAAYPKSESIGGTSTAYMPIEGYAEVDQEPLIMVGSISIYDSAPLTDKNIGSNLTPTAAQKAKDIVSSLSKSTFKVDAR